METKHTPGPWSRNIAPARKYSTIFAGRNTHVANLCVQGLTDEEIEANCNLIAAAPALLAALKLFREWSDQDAGADQLDAAMGACRAAIAKAEGR